ILDQCRARFQARHLDAAHQSLQCRLAPKAEGFEFKAFEILAQKGVVQWVRFKVGSFDVDIHRLVVFTGRACSRSPVHLWCVASSSRSKTGRRTPGTARCTIAGSVNRTCTSAPGRLCSMPRWRYSWALDSFKK